MEKELPCHEAGKQKPWTASFFRRYRCFSRAKRDSGSLPRGKHNSNPVKPNKDKAQDGNIFNDAPVFPKYADKLGFVILLY